MCLNKTLAKRPAESRECYGNQLAVHFLSLYEPVWDCEYDGGPYGRGDRDGFPPTRNNAAWAPRDNSSTQIGSEPFSRDSKYCITMSPSPKPLHVCKGGCRGAGLHFGAEFPLGPQPQLCSPSSTPQLLFNTTEPAACISKLNLSECSTEKIICNSEANMPSILT